MTRFEYDQVKEKVLQRFQVEAAPAIARRDRDLEALERIWELAGDMEVSTGTQDVPAEPVGEQVDETAARVIQHFYSPMQATRDVINTVAQPFSITELHPEIERISQRQVNRTSVSSILNRLATDTFEIIQVRPGGGRYPAYYRRSTNQERQEALDNKRKQELDQEVHEKYGSTAPAQ